MSKNVIVIPIYKTEMKQTEEMSLRQCLKVLGKHDIRFTCPPNLDLTVYKNLFAEYDKELVIEEFDAYYFRDINGYNSLLLSAFFYERFEQWEYMLIYQPDAYIFSDKFGYWCEQGYDYIGAPWCKFRTLELDPINTGNGGFSLRKIESCKNAITHKGKLLTWEGLKYLYSERGPYRKPLLLFAGLFGYHNTSKSIIKNDLANEDKFFAMQRYRRKNPLKVPNSDVAMHFSFEQIPSKLYELTGNKLPFGCHAWERYEYDSFWSKFIIKKVLS